MAAIDKMYLRDYSIFDKFRLWCIVHKPTLLYHFYNWNMNEKEWDEWKEQCYNSHKEILEQAHKYCSSFKKLRKHYDDLSKVIEEKYPNEFLDKVSDEQIKEEVQEHLKGWKEIQNKETWIENLKLPITNFSCEEDKYLLWHCPIEEVRDYLINQCGYKEKRYHKLFFKD